MNEKLLLIHHYYSLALIINDTILTCNAIIVSFQLKNFLNNRISITFKACTLWYSSRKSIGRISKNIQHWSNLLGTIREKIMLQRNCPFAGELGLISYHSRNGNARISYIPVTRSVIFISPIICINIPRHDFKSESLNHSPGTRTDICD